MGRLSGGELLQRLKLRLPHEKESIWFDFLNNEARKDDTLCWGLTVLFTHASLNEARPWFFTQIERIESEAPLLMHPDAGSSDLEKNKSRALRIF